MYRRNYEKQAKLIREAKKIQNMYEFGFSFEDLESDMLILAIEQTSKAFALQRIEEDLSLQDGLRKRKIDQNA